MNFLLTCTFCSISVFKSSLSAATVTALHLASAEACEVSVVCTCCTAVTLAGTLLNIHIMSCDVFVEDVEGGSESYSIVPEK